MVYVGTSGYAYKEWKGPFYPAGLKDAEFLRYYSTQFPAVEINNTFYRMPREQMLVDWAAQVPDRFRFAIKATQRITHHHQLKDAGELLGYLVETCAVLGDKLGPMLFQLPPHLKKDLPRLTDFLALVPKRMKAAFEFRHPSWLDDDVYDALKGSEAALCISDQAEFTTPIVSTAPWSYVRLHNNYDELALAEWGRRLRTQPWTETYVFFKHDHQVGSGPLVAQALITALGA